MKLKNPIELSEAEKAKLTSIIPTVSVSWRLGRRLADAAKVAFEETIPTVKVERRKRPTE